jgi:glycosyltransferase involved in cell wall biosynthesis
MNIVRKKKILLIGPLPPPKGGVSIHLDRLSKLLENDYDIEFIDESHLIKKKYFNLRSFNLARYFKIVKSVDLIHINSGTSLLRIFHIIIGTLLFKKIILTIHAYPTRKNFFLRYIDRIFFSLPDLVIVVNPDIFARVSLPARKSIIKEAFIPPIMEMEPDLPDKVIAWINNRKSVNRIIICANAYRLEIFNDQDLYGLDMCIEAANYLINNGYHVSFIFNVSTLEKYEERYDRFTLDIENYNLQDNFLLINENLSFVNLISSSDIVLRPTNTDGDALTIREALYLGKPIIASDVVVRPLGTVLFKSRNADDLVDKIISVVNSYSKTDHQMNKDFENDFKKEYIEMIESYTSMSRK